MRRTRLSNCQARAHAFCHGHQLCFGPRAPAEVIICSCPCGHDAAVRLAIAGVLRPPAGFTVEQFAAAVERVEGEAP